MLRQGLKSIRRAVVRSAATVTVVATALEVTTHLPSQGRSSLFYHQLADDWITPLMRRFLDPETAHNVAIYLAQRGLCPRFHPSAAEQRLVVESKPFGVTFANPIGLAAGFDKDGTVMGPMLQLGFGFVEIGTVTPLPQEGNPKPRMFRLPSDLAIINRYGFNSAGGDAVEEHLKSYRRDESGEQSSTSSAKDENVWEAAFRSFRNFLFPAIPPHRGVVGVNIGKNKNTDNAIQDYVSLVQKLSPYADYMVVNISSPNTAGLRDWQEVDNLRPLLQQVLTAARRDATRAVPILVKLAPDLTSEQLQDIAALCMELSVDGLVVSNTTTSSTKTDQLVSFHRHEQGGLSGKPVRDLSTSCISQLYAWTNGSIPIIGVGGVSSGQDAYQKLRAGASLVQVYSSIVYEGPGVVSRIRKELAECMLQNGHRSLDEVIGSDHDAISWRMREERVKRAEEATRERSLVIADGLESS